SSIILFIILIGIIFHINRKISKSNFITVILTFVFSFSFNVFVTARAQLFSYILFLLQFLFIENFLESGKKKYLLGLLLISLILCNVHVAVWPFYYILYLPYIAEYLFSIIYKKINLKKDNKLRKFIDSRFEFEENKNVKYLLFIITISFLTGLLTPIGTTPYTYLIKTMLGNSQKYIMEHQMISGGELIFVITTLIGMLFFLITSKTKLRDIFLMLGLSIMAISSIRHSSLLSMFSILFLSRSLKKLFEKYSLNIEEWFEKITKKKSFLILFGLCIVATSIFMFNENLKEEYVDLTLYPSDAVKYIKENIETDEMRLYNQYNFGSYLLFNDISVFIDSRADLYTKQFSGFKYDILDDYFNSKNIEDYEKIFNFYKITHILVYNKSELNYIISTNNKYKVLYFDDYFVLYEIIKNN
ncbi:MAG: hypothetical protein PUD59_03855, partial [bacterium]|nr:hypothetical protein [bacterium]